MNILGKMEGIYIIIVFFCLIFCVCGIILVLCLNLVLFRVYPLFIKKTVFILKIQMFKVINLDLFRVYTLVIQVSILNMFN